MWHASCPAALLECVESFVWASLSPLSRQAVQTQRLGYIAGHGSQLAGLLGAEGRSAFDVAPLAPQVECAGPLSRLGGEEGGLCGLEQLNGDKAACTALSLVISGDLSWEEGLARSTGCHVHVLSCLPAPAAGGSSSLVHLHSVCISALDSANGRNLTLATALRELKLGSTSVLRMDLGGGSTPWWMTCYAALGLIPPSLAYCQSSSCFTCATLTCQGCPWACKCPWNHWEGFF
jgi:hypothetical protein